jgi:hypothetical protein
LPTAHAQPDRRLGARGKPEKQHFVQRGRGANRFAEYAREVPAVFRVVVQSTELGPALRPAFPFLLPTEHFYDCRLSYFH